MHHGEDAVHGVGDGARYGAVDGGGGGLVLFSAGIGDNASGRNRAVLQRPGETGMPVLAYIIRFHFGQSDSHAIIGRLDIGIDLVAELVLQAILLVPDICGCRLKGDLCLAVFCRRICRCHIQRAGRIAHISSP